MVAPFWKVFASRLRLGRLWLIREIGRLIFGLGLGAVFGALCYGLLTGTLALLITMGMGTTRPLPVFLAGAIGAAAGTIVLIPFLPSDLSTKGQFDAEKRVLNAMLSEQRIAKATREQQRLVAKERAPLQAARDAPQQFAQDEDEPPISELGRDRAKAALANCWYCKQSHAQLVQCPFCRMLCAHA